MVGYYNSFVVRIWSDEQGLARGSIQHVRSHDSLVFGDLATILEFIRVHLAPPPSYIIPPKADGNPEEKPAPLDVDSSRRALDA
ncbi:MAG: hypothetical protein HY782_24640 [Chloroflexi bacterium]|nr:hypothetical protein [Chloroflexota bacterium]